MSIALVRYLGVRGVILGTVVSNLALFPVVMRYSLRTLKVSGGQWMHRVVLPTYPPLLIPVAVGLLTIHLGLTRYLIGVAAAGILCVFSYWATLYVVSFDAGERADVASLVGSLRNRFAGGRRG